MRSLHKLEFAVALRGIAALLVAISHLFGNFWYSRGSTAAYLHAPPLPADMTTPWLPKLYMDGFRQVSFGGYYSDGQLGVGLFFLISGFVIPFALQRQSPVSFLIARFFRIWPLYAAGLCVSIFTVAVASGFFGHMYLPTPLAILSHLTFSEDVAGVPLIDGIVWTLDIEVRFYLICALLAPSLRSGNWSALLILGALATAFAAYASRTTESPFLLCLASTGRFITLMFVGTVFNFLHRQKIRFPAALFCAFGLLALFYFDTSIIPTTTRSGAFVAPGLPFLPSYLLSVALFAGCFALRESFQRTCVLHHLAEISYPLYVIHAMLGESAMRVLIGAGVSPDIAVSAALLLVWGVSWLAHIAVEAPAHRFGRHLAERIDVLWATQSVLRPDADWQEPSNTD